MFLDVSFEVCLLVVLAVFLYQDFIKIGSLAVLLFSSLAISRLTVCLFRSFFFSFRLFLPVDFYRRRSWDLSIYLSLKSYSSLLSLFKFIQIWKLSVDRILYLVSLRTLEYLRIHRILDFSPKATFFRFSKFIAREKVFGSYIT